MMEKQILIAVEPEGLEKLLKKMEALERSIEERFDALSKRLELVEIAIRDRNIEDQIQKEYVIKSEALKIFPYKNTKLTEFTKLKLSNGEQIVRTICPSGAVRGIVYFVADLRDAPRRYEQYNREQQSMDRKRR